MRRNHCPIIPLPVTPADKLITSFREYLHLPDPGPVQVLMGAVAANMLEGVPVWLMLVGPPSCGKSELLRSTLAIDHIVDTGDISNESAFLSGTPPKEWHKDATGGLFRQIGTHGGLILNEFNSVLCKPREKIANIMAIFREAYSGSWTRHIGGEGGRLLEWTGKLALFAGCTGRIDQEHQISAEMGERWVYYRFEWNDGFAALQKSLSNRGENWQKALRETVRQFFLSLGIQFGLSAPHRELTTAELIEIHKLASVATACRSGVMRDPYNKEVLNSKEAELCVRLGNVLTQLLIGMEFIGVMEKDRWRLLHKVAMDSMPQVRRLIIEMAGKTPTTAEKLQQAIGCSLNVIKRTVEDLRIHEVLIEEHGIIQHSEWMKLNRLRKNPR